MATPAPPSHFAADNAKSPLTPDGKVYFVYGPRGKAHVYACPLEQARNWDGDNIVQAVQVTCPGCGSCGRVTVDKPFRISPVRSVFETELGAIPLSPLLTIESEYICKTELRLFDTETGEQQEAVCTFQAVIRNGIAYDLDVVPKILTDLMQSAEQSIQKANAAFARVRPKLPPQVQQGIGTIIGRAQQVLVATCPVIERGVYQRGGERSVVGCWDSLEWIYGACMKVLSDLSKV